MQKGKLLLGLLFILSSTLVFAEETVTTETYTEETTTTKIEEKEGLFGHEHKNVESEHHSEHDNDEDNDGENEVVDAL